MSTTIPIDPIIRERLAWIITDHANAEDVDGLIAEIVQLVGDQKQLAPRSIPSSVERQAAEMERGPMAEHYNRLTPEQLERLALLAEECAEVIKAVMKIQRHGYESRNPTIAYSLSNRQALAQEIGHVRAAISLLCDAGDVNSGLTLLSRDEKLGSVQGWLHHAIVPDAWRDLSGAAER